MRIPHLLAAIAASAIATTACKKTPKPGPEEKSESPPISPSVSPGAESAATTAWGLDELHDVKTTSPVQGIAIWAQELDYSGASVDHQVMFEHGRRCLGGASQNECAKSWGALVEQQRKAKARAYAIVTRDVDTHQLVTDEKQLRALLGPIDTPAEAAILATFLGASKVFVPQCDGISKTIVMEKTAEGYSMALEKRARKGTLKNASGVLLCTDCIIAETRKNVVVRPDGVVVLGSAEEGEWIPPMGCGRSPGWTERDAPRARSAAEYLARAAYLEAASVVAFERIALELAALGAPAGLVARARRAAIEETAHAGILGRLARAHGAEPLGFATRPYALRDAFELAVDNAVEGCVNETYGALLLHVQALRAEDASMRAAFASIAGDEASHAELSAELAAWLDTRLSDNERAAVRSAAMQARMQLDTRPAIDDDDERRRLGLPDGTTTRRLYARLDVEARAAERPQAGVDRPRP